MSPATTGSLHEVGDGVFAWLAPTGSWGWSNAGLVAGGTAGSSDPERSSLLVDTLFDLRLTRAMLDAMGAAVPEARTIGTVVNTHANGDHCYGNQLVAGADIVASTACADEMARVPPAMLAALVGGGDVLGPAGTFAARIFGSFAFDGIELTLPTTTFDGELTLEVAGREVRLYELGPAHTTGDVVVHLPAERVVFTGDLLFHGGHPVMWEGPVERWIDALDRIVALDAEVVVPGHGPLADNRALGELKDYFLWLREEARTRWEAGMSPLDAARDLDLGPYASWSDPERLAVNIAGIYRSLDPAAATPDVLALLSDMAALAHPS